MIRGIQTSEFWLAVITAAVMLLRVLGVHLPFVQALDDNQANLATAIAGGVSAIYIAARTVYKVFAPSSAPSFPGDSTAAPVAAPVTTPTDAAPAPVAAQ